MKNVLQIITILLLVAGISLSFILTTKRYDENTKKLTDQIQELTNQIQEQTKSVETNLNNQTSLFYRTIGEAIPVVVPENDKKKFDELQNSINNLKEKQDNLTLSEASSMYMDFIRNTAPWIQESMANEIMTAKYEIDYYSLLVAYKKDNDLYSLIDGLESFILASNDYSDIQTVIEYYNKLVDEQSKDYEDSIKLLKGKIAEALANKNISSSEIVELVNQCQSYDDEVFNNDLAELNSCLSEVMLKEQIATDLNNSKKQLAEINFEDEGSSVTLGVITQNIAEYIYNAKTISNIDNSDLLEDLNGTLNRISELQKESKKHEESLLLQDIDSSIDICEKELNGLSTDAISSSMISIIATQLATLQYNLDSLTLVDANESKKKLADCKNKLTSKENSISAGLSGQEKEQLTAYNRNALYRINSINSDNQEIGTFESDKKSKRISLLLKLEEINQNYLYLSVNTLYQQVYQEIWNALDSDSRFEVAKSAINISKKELNESF